MRNEKTITDAQVRAPILLVSSPDAPCKLHDGIGERFEVRVVRSAADAFVALTELSLHPRVHEGVIAIDALLQGSEVVAAWACALVPSAKLLMVHPPLRAMKQLLSLQQTGVPCTYGTIANYACAIK